MLEGTRGRHGLSCDRCLAPLTVVLRFGAVLLLSGCLGVAEESLISARVDAGATVDVADSGSEARDAGHEPVDAGPGEPDAGGGDAGTSVPDGGRLDSGTSDAGAPSDAGSSLVPVFVLVGKQGRRAISCDDGRSWKNDVSFDDALPASLQFHCFSGAFALPDGGSNNTDCDHNGWSSTALASLGDAFVHTMGWGAPGTFWRSTDGVTWTQTFTGANVQDVMVGPSRLIVATRGTKRSDDRGLTWTSGPDVRLQSGASDIWNVRGGAYGGGSYVVSAQDGTNTDWQVSRDEGASWQRPQLVGGGRIDACGSAHPVYGNGVFVSATWNGTRTIFCRSADEGLNWTVLNGPTDMMESRPLFTGSAFMIWSNGKVHRSTDGSTWTTMNTVTRSPTGMMGGGPNVGPVAVSAVGTFVAVRGGWDVWYDKQRFYRSSDGITWDELPATAYRRWHPVTMMVAGLAARSSVCP